MALVMHSLIKAVAFTGSFKGGKALYDAAASRGEPIPVYAEMGSINPVFALPCKLKEDSEEIAKALVASSTLGSGQFCTNPGILIMLKSAEADEFQTKFGKHLAEVTGGTMLSESIYDSYCQGISRLELIPELTLIGKGQGSTCSAIPHAFSVSGTEFLRNKDLAEEYFGPSSIHVLAEDRKQLIEIAQNLPGQLTAGIWASDNELDEFEELFRVLENKAGRLMLNNVPTGVEVTHAMIHGGPFPATFDGKTTSVGTGAIYRFTRPVCYQNYPQKLLPEALKNKNPLSMWRLVNGEFTREECV